MVLLVLPFISFTTNGQDVGIDSTITRLTLRQKIGQLLIFGYSGQTVETELKQLIHDEQPGALITFSRNIKDLNQIGSLNKVAQNWSKQQNGLPLMIMVDQEGGNVARLKMNSPLPSALALGETRDASLVEQYGEAMGRLMAGLGFTMNLAPVLDLSDPWIPSFIGPRSFGSRPVLVGEVAVAFARGLARGGIIPTAKHFPGHGGISQDSHRLTPRKLATLAELIKGDLVPFQKFAQADFPRAVMMAHISYPQIDPTGAPSAFSSVFIQSVLRQGMHYDGLIITDDVEMSGANAAGSVEERVVKAIEAGNDMVMVAWSAARQKRAEEALVQAVEANRISVERINESVRRVLKYKMMLPNVLATPAQTAQAKFNLENIAEKIKRFNFLTTARLNSRLRGVLSDRAAVTLLAADGRFYRNFRSRYSGPVQFIHLSPTAHEELEAELLAHPEKTFIYYASGYQTASWLNQLTADVKKQIVVVNTNQPGAIENSRGYRGVFQLNTLIPESGRWLAEYLTDGG